MSSRRRAQHSTAAAGLLQDWICIEGPLLKPPQTTHNPETGQTLTFEKVRIDFPLKPYPAQVQMMRNIVRTLNNSENALLESPTGSGKSLALLCATLAWRENEEKKVAEEIAARNKEINKIKVELKAKADLITAQLASNDTLSTRLPVNELESLAITNIDSASKKDIETPANTDMQKHRNTNDSITNDSAMLTETSSVSVQAEESSNIVEKTEISINEISNVSIKTDLSNIPTQTEISCEPVNNDTSSINPTSKRELEDNHPSNWMKKFKCDNNNVITVEEDSFEDFQFIKKPVKNEQSGSSSPNESDPVNNLKYQTFKELPRIYVGSRTHKQITQLISELKNKTRYNPRTTVLASREQLCIHPKISKLANKTEGCIELLDKKGCMYKHKTNLITNDHAIKVTNKVWDIEDIVKIGKKSKGCPFYASRKLFEFAEVIFCPYNYIIDPVIRSIMDINLKESIIILDEAHNIEDAARSAGSFDVDETLLIIVKKELDQIIRNGYEKEAHQHLEVVVEQMYDWITSEDNVYSIKEYETHHCNWTGASIHRKLTEASITAHIFHNVLTPAFRTAKAHADQIRKDSENDIPENNEEISASQVQIHFRKCLSNNSLSVLQGIFMVFGFLFREGKNYVEDYQMILTKRIERSGGRGNQGFKKRRKKSDMDPEWTFKLGFRCLNPGIIFKDMSETTKSVVLTSGTLSPLNTFASELETNFEARLEANHVIDKSQVWVGAIPAGPNGITLRGVYKNWESFAYQDDIGESLCSIVERVPFGVLCFLPSYNSLDKLVERWKVTELYDRLSSRKMIHCEPRGSDKKEFENTIGSFYKQIDDVKNGPDELGRDGALFFAVFRGKVSEGIDFTDNYCRAVVTVGIPYPSIKDIEVKFKKEYNDMKKNRARNADLLSGSDWYSSQAFRAINQALGRCIRHRNDWGAIILLEDRFQTSINIGNLSKWVRNQLIVHHNFHESMMKLNDFVELQLERTDVSSIESCVAPSPLQITAATSEGTTPAESIVGIPTLPEINDVDNVANVHYIKEISQTSVKKEPLNDMSSYNEASPSSKISSTLPNEALPTCKSEYFNYQNPPSSMILLSYTPPIMSPSYPQSCALSNQAIPEHHTELSSNRNQNIIPINKDTQLKKEFDNDRSFNNSIFSESSSFLEPIIIDSDDEFCLSNEPIVSKEPKISDKPLESTIQHEIEVIGKPVEITNLQELEVSHSPVKTNILQEPENFHRPVETIIPQEPERPYKPVETIVQQEPERFQRPAEPIIRQEPERFQKPSEPIIRQEPESFDNPSEKTIKQESFQRNVEPNHVPISLVRKDFCSIRRDDISNVCISCTWCGTVLLEGPTQHIQPTTIYDLNVITNNPNIDPKDIVQVNEPKKWKVSDCLSGGPIDINKWPTESSVIFHKEDSICFRWLTCTCNVARTTGMIVRQAFGTRNSKYRGKVFLWLNQLCVQKVEKKLDASGISSSVNEEIEIPSSQAANMNDMFYHL